MATVSRIASFWRAFFAVLLSGSFVSAATRDEAEAWQAALAVNTADAYYQFLSLFPAGEYVDDAVAALGRLGAVGRPRDISPVRPSTPAARRGGGIY